MAGLAPISLQQRSDRNGKPLAGAKAYFYAADALTPITIYQDYGLGVAHPNPVVADAYGTFPPIFLDEALSFYRMRLTTATGIVINDLSTLPVIGPAVGGGGGSDTPVDPNSLFKVGDVIWLDQSGSRPGWVRDNGRSIGSATSGASERANADCESLFSFLWQTYNDAVCPVVGGRGVSAPADWAANKYISLPDKRGLVAGGLDNMGNSTLGRLTSVPVVSGDSTTAGSILGESFHGLSTQEIPNHNHTLHDPGHSHVFARYSDADGRGGTDEIGYLRGSIGVSTDGNTTGITIDAVGGGQVHNNVQMTVLGTFYRKL